VAWETLYENANNVILSPAGNATAAVVQVKSLAQADIATFQDGIFSVAVNGEAWDSIFVNCWNPAFDAAGKRVATTVRTNLYDYTIAVDGKPWAGTTAALGVRSSTRPRVRSPRRSARPEPGAWPLTTSWPGIPSSPSSGIRPTPDGSKLAAIVAPSFGAFTVAVDGTPWAATFPVVTDLVISATGGHVAALGSNDNTAFAVLCDGKVWGGRYDMAWKPVFSADGAHLAVNVERGGVHTVVCDGKAYPKSFEKCFAPAFSPDGTKVLIRGIEGGKAYRIVAPLEAFTG